MVTGTADPSVSEPAARRRESGWRRALRQRVPLRRAIVSIIVVLVVWEVVVRVFAISSLTIVPPSKVAVAFWEEVQDGSLGTNLSVSMVQFVLGFLLASVIAIPLGLFLGGSERGRHFSDPWMIGLYATPSVALAPLFIVTLGLGLSAHVAVIALTAFFPIAINTMDGVLAVDRTLRDVGMAYRASRGEVFRKIALPAAAPYIFTGLRLGLARGLVGVVVADLFGATAGLGYMILNASQAFDTAKVFVGVFVLAGLGIVFTVGLKYLQRRLTPWSEEFAQ